MATPSKKGLVSFPKDWRKGFTCAHPVLGHSQVTFLLLNFKHLKGTFAMNPSQSGIIVFALNSNKDLSEKIAR